jgi:DNA-binding NarL/FixJ family response regulator
MTTNGRHLYGRNFSVGPVLILVHHPLFSSALQIALASEGFDAHELPASAQSDVLAAAAQFPPGLVLLDLSLEAASADDPIPSANLVSAFHGQGKRVLVLTGDRDERAAAAAVAAGAIGVEGQDDSWEELIHVIKSAASGQPVMSEPERYRWLDRHHRNRQNAQLLQKRLQRLTRREHEVLDMIVEGHRAEQIARQFVVSVATVRTQIRAILAKLEVSSQLEAVALVVGSSKIDRLHRPGAVAVGPAARPDA